ncbi:MAG: biopolymer transporter ExbD [Victivallaceae bacterium]|nr:biopolymer transporter ExbD [Victivallaceae bacterium]
MELRRFGRRRYAPKVQAIAGRPDYTSLVDVLFLTLIFFMLSSSFVQVSGIKVELPEVNTSGSQGIEKFIVSIAHSEKGTLYYFNDQPITLEALAEKFSGVSAVSRTGTVIVRSDKLVPFEDVARVMALAEKANLNSFIAVMQGKRPRETVFGSEKIQ